MATFLSSLFIAAVVTALRHRSAVLGKITHLIFALLFAMGFSLLAQQFFPFVTIYSGYGVDLGMLSTIAGAFFGNWLVDRYQSRFIDYLEEQLQDS